jgi:hypothetical protein
MAPWGGVQNLRGIVQGPVGHRVGKSHLATGKLRILFNEAKFVAKGVLTVKAAFTPRLRLDWPKDWAVWLSTYSPEVLLEILHCKIQMIRIWRRIPCIAVSSRIKASKDDAAATEVMPSRRDPASRLVEQGRVKDGSFLNTGDGDNHAK